MQVFSHFAFLPRLLTHADVSTAFHLAASGDPDNSKQRDPSLPVTMSEFEVVLIHIAVHVDKESLSVWERCQKLLDIFDLAIQKSSYKERICGETSEAGWLATLG